MELDTRTLVLCSIFVVGINGSLSLYFGYLYPGTRTLKHVGAGLLLFTVSMIGVALRGGIPDFLSISVSGALGVTSVVLVDRGVRMYTQEETRDVLGWTLVAITLAGQTLLYQNSSNVGLRIGFISVSYSVLLARLAWRLRRFEPPGAPHAFRFTEGLFWVWSALNVLRGVGGFVGPAQLDFMSPHPVQTLTFAIAMAFVAALMLGFLWMEVYWLHQELTWRATRDPLTGVLNRNTFFTLCEAELEQCESDGKPFSLVLFDVDDFKRINDTWGHLVGDAVLQHVVEILRESLREQDVVARFGGEEFAVLLPATRFETAWELAECARMQLIQTELKVDGQPISISISGGVSCYPRGGGSLPALFTAADAALYQAKRNGRNRVELAPAVPSLGS